MSYYRLYLGSTPHPVKKLVGKIFMDRLIMFAQNNVSKNSCRSNPVTTVRGGNPTKPYKSPLLALKINRSYKLTINGRPLKWVTQVLIFQKKDIGRSSIATSCTSCRSSSTAIGYQSWSWCPGTGAVGRAEMPWKNHGNLRVPTPKAPPQSPTK